jgi:hypothetical protein
MVCESVYSNILLEAKCLCLWDAFGGLAKSLHTCMVCSLKIININKFKRFVPVFLSQLRAAPL